MLIVLILWLVAPWIDKALEELKVDKKKGQQVSFECRAGGFPLEVQWQAEAFKKDSIIPSKCISKGDVYTLHYLIN